MAEKRKERYIFLFSFFYPFIYGIICYNRKGDKKLNYIIARSEKEWWWV
jgi:hypothetical protein